MAAGHVGPGGVFRERAGAEATQDLGSSRVPFLFSAVPHSMWDLRSLTRNRPMHCKHGGPNHWTAREVLRGSVSWL